MGSLGGLWGHGDRTPRMGLGNAISPPASQVQFQKGCPKHSCLHHNSASPYK